VSPVLVVSVERSQSAVEGAVSPVLVVRAEVLRVHWRARLPARPVPSDTHRGSRTSAERGTGSPPPSTTERTAQNGVTAPVYNGEDRAERGHRPRLQRRGPRGTGSPPPSTTERTARNGVTAPVYSGEDRAERGHRPRLQRRGPPILTHFESHCFSQATHLEGGVKPPHSKAIRGRDWGCVSPLL